MSDELKPPRDVIAENAARQCTPQNKGPITWALSSVMREFARADGLEDAAHDALVDAVSRVIATYDKYAKESRPAPEQSGEARCDVGHAHFTPFYLLANARRIVSREYSRKPNWALAMDLFAVGSTTANRICREAGIDPDGTTVTRAAMDRSALGREA